MDEVVHLRRARGCGRDHLLTNVMLYRLTGTAASSSRVYYENAHGSYFMSMQRSETPELLAGDIRDIFRAASGRR